MSAEELRALEVALLAQQERLESADSAISPKKGGTPEDLAVYGDFEPILLVIYHPLCTGHYLERHPEQPGRVKAIRKVLKAPSVLDTLPSPLFFLEDFPPVTDKQLLLFHTPRHLERLRVASDRAQESGMVVVVDEDTAVMGRTLEAAELAAGGACAAVDAAMLGVDGSRYRVAFSLCRPPGHHAEPERAMGFCFFNNAGVAAQYARDTYGMERVAVVDIDVHHGNGIQAGFRDDANLFYGSTHQGDAYPFTGDPSITGVNRNILNIPLSAGDGSAVFREILEVRMAPALRRFDPDLFILSVGFDALAEDPLAGVNLASEDYAFATRILGGAVRRDVPVIALLEGGYDLRAMADAAVHVTRELCHLALGSYDEPPIPAADQQELSGDREAFGDLLSDSGESWGDSEPDLRDRIGEVYEMEDVPADDVES